MTGTRLAFPIQTTPANLLTWTEIKCFPGDTRNDWPPPPTQQTSGSPVERIAALRRVGKEKGMAPWKKALVRYSDSPCLSAFLSANPLHTQGAGGN